MRRYKENKEKLRRRKEDSKRRKLLANTLATAAAAVPAIEPLSRKLTKLTEGLPILSQDDTDLDDNGPFAPSLANNASALHSDDELATLNDGSPLISTGLALKNKKVDELDGLQKPYKRKLVQNTVHMKMHADVDAHA